LLLFIQNVYGVLSFFYARETNYIILKCILITKISFFLTSTAYISLIVYDDPQ